MISRTSNELPCFVILDDGFYWKVRIEMADGVRFELTQDCSWPVFKTGVFNRSTTHPQNEWQPFFIISWLSWLSFNQIYIFVRYFYNSRNQGLGMQLFQC